MTADDTNDKQLYAHALLKHPDDPYKAALMVVGGDLARGLVMSREWPQDPEVIEYRAMALADKGEDAFLPSKADVVRAIWDKAEKCRDPDVAFKGYKMVADIMGYVEKPGTTINNNTLVDQRKVMVVTDHGTDEEWEAKLLKQQAALTHDGARSAIN
jgi:hypothetical protein